MSRLTQDSDNTKYAPARLIILAIGLFIFTMVTLYSRANNHEIEITFFEKDGMCFSKSTKISTGRIISCVPIECEKIKK